VALLIATSAPYHITHFPNIISVVLPVLIGLPIWYTTIIKSSGRHAQKKHLQGSSHRRLRVLPTTPSVGKTSLLTAFTEDKFVRAYKATIGADFTEKSLIVDGKEVVMEVGLSRYRFGTLPARRDSSRSGLASTAGLIAV
jgi:hypothetical protein